MKFWDSSALVPLMVAQPTSRSLQTIASRDPEMFVWWAAEVECTSALCRLRRENVLGPEGAEFSFGKLRQFADRWDEIEPSEIIRETANRFLRVHPLRAADSLQLAAAFVAADGRPSSLEVVTLDDRLAEAARKEGFTIIEVQAA